MSERSDRPGIIMELLETDLQQFIRESQRVQKCHSHPFSEEKTLYIMKEIAQGMAYLHGKDIEHGDLKSLNVLIKPYRDTNYLLDVKIVDFGASRCRTTRLANQRRIEVGTRLWRAPELRTDKSISISFDPKKADVYSFAITCGEILGADIHGDGGIFMNVYERIINGWRPK